jgi:2-polyprenyl-3-methyl-5-hydroxy-6-metoxy-1,4-benzoquinol methylase
MMVHHIPFPLSAGMRRENEAQRAFISGWNIEDVRTCFPDGQAYCRKYSASAEGQQLLRLLNRLQPGARILDVGAGYGTIAVCLASLGYRVTAVEISPDLCAHLERVAKLYGLSIGIYHVSAECLDQLPETGFDACMFNASLHHCDDPERALANCHDLLTPGGQLFMLNEPVLQFFRTKAWFARKLTQGTLITGDYGGNEHTYRYRDYPKMMRRAGFEHIRDFLALRYTQPHNYLRYLSAQGASRTSLLARKLYYAAMSRICRAGVLGKLVLFVLKHLSLLQTDFVAVKPSPYRSQCGGETAASCQVVR